MRSSSRRDAAEQLLTARAAHVDYKARYERLKAEHEALLARMGMVRQDLNAAIRNSQQLVAAVLQARLRRARTPEAQRAVEASRLRVYALSTVFAQRDLDGSDDVIDFAPTLSAVSKEIEALCGRRGLGLRIEATRTPVRLRHAQSLALLSAELVTNAFEHAFVGRPFGLVEVGIRPAQPQGGHLWVADNGRGLKRPPVDRDRDVVTSLAANLASQVEYTNARPGTRIDVRF